MTPHYSEVLLTEKIVAKYFENMAMLESCNVDRNAWLCSVVEVYAGKWLEYIQFML